MKIISHRGNLDGPEPYSENKPEKIDFVLSLGYDVEIDVWYKDNEFYLGHDTPETIIHGSFLTDRSKHLWVHCKNIACLNKLKLWDLNYFFHEHDMVTLTSKHYIWSYPEVQEFYSNQICLDFTPQVNYKFYESKFIAGLCVDYIKGVV